MFERNESYQPQICLAGLKIRRDQKRKIHLEMEVLETYILTDLRKSFIFLLHFHAVLPPQFDGGTISTPTPTIYKNLENCNMR